MFQNVVFIGSVEVFAIPRNSQSWRLRGKALKGKSEGDSCSDRETIRRAAIDMD